MLKDDIDSIDKLLDEDKIEWLSIISDYEYRVLSKVAIRGKIFGDELAETIVKRKLAMAVSREGERSEQLIEFAKSIQLEDLGASERIDAFEDSGTILAEPEKGVDKA